ERFRKQERVAELVAEADFQRTHRNSDQMLGIERGERTVDKAPILPNHFPVEQNLTTAPVRALDADHVPMDLPPVAVVSLLIRLAGREMEGAGDLLVEQNVAHWLQNVRIERDGELADVARPLVGIENLVELPGQPAAGFRLHHPALLEIEP